VPYSSIPVMTRTAVVEMTTMKSGQCKKSMHETRMRCGFFGNDGLPCLLYWRLSRQSERDHCLIVVHEFQFMNTEIY